MKKSLYYTLILTLLILLSGFKYYEKPHISISPNDILFAEDTSNGYSTSHILFNDIINYFRGIYTPYSPILSSISNGVIDTNLDNTKYPWADNETSNTLTITAQPGSTWDLANSITALSVYTGNASLDDSTSAIKSGAYIVKCFDEFANSTGNDTQTVLDDLDAALDLRCLESVFGTSLKNRLSLNGTALDVSAVLEKYHGVDPSADVLAMLGSANDTALRTEIGLGSAATRSAEDTMTDGPNLPDGHAVKIYGDANWGGAGGGNVTGPSVHLADYAPLWGAVNSTSLVEGYFITAAGKALLDDADAAAQRTTLGLGAAALLAVENALSADDNATLCTSYAIKKYGDDNWGASGGNVTSTNNITDNRLVRGDGGAKGVQETGITIDDSNNMTGVVTINTGQGAYELYAMNQDVETDDNVTFGKVTSTQGFVSGAVPLPGWEFDVSSTLQKTIDAHIYAQATDSGNGTVDIDLRGKVLVNDILTSRMHLDADGNNNFPGADFNIDNGKVYKINNVQITSAALSNDASLAKATGDIYTGNHDFGGADLELPQGQTPDTDGDVDLDFTDGSLVVQHGSAHAELLTSTDVVMGKLIKSFTATLAQPDLLQAEIDNWPLEPIEASEFPHGIVITDIYLKTSASSTYAINVENWDDPTTINVSNGTIDAITTSSSTEAHEDTITYATIAAGQIIMLDLPTDNISWVEIQVEYYEPIS